MGNTGETGSRKLYNSRSTLNMKKSIKNWVIIGSSRGLGAALVEELLHQTSSHITAQILHLHDLEVKLEGPDP